MEKCLLVIIELSSDKNRWPRADVAQELSQLVKTAGGQVVGQIFCPRNRPTPEIFIGKGKAEEIAFLCETQDIDTVIFSHDLSGTQQRNLEEILGKKTIDRTQLILDIFCRHAHSPEGKMQVELAQLEYLLPRLVGKGIALSRLGAGIGTRGPGEQKLEVDRRRIREKIFKLKRDLKHLLIHRNILRKKRKDEDIFCVAFVGYTNAGKSTLLNTLTQADQKVEDSLFTTLDPLSRRLELPSGAKIVLTDTVGFLHQLPHHLIQAFHATLEEVVQADLLIHVLDASHRRIQEHNCAVMEVLSQLECQDKPIIVALNKIDLVDDQAWLSWLEERFSNSVSISAKLGLNLDQLIKKIEGYLKPRMKKVTLSVSLNRMDLVDYIYRKAKVLKTEYEAKSVRLVVNIPTNQLSNLLKFKEVTIIN